MSPSLTGRGYWTPANVRSMFDLLNCRERRSGQIKRAGVCTGPLRSQLLLLLAFGMRLIGVLVSGLRMLLRARRMFLALGMVALAVVFGGGAMGLGGVFVMFGGLVVFVFSHGILLG
jgi:hypothetical protein